VAPEPCRNGPARPHCLLPAIATASPGIRDSDLSAGLTMEETRYFCVKGKEEQEGGNGKGKLN